MKESEVNDKKDGTASLDQAGESQEKSFFGIVIHSFFVVPFLIAVFSVLLFAAVRILTMEQHTIYDYLNDVKAGSLTKRWQSAFELSKMMANQKLIPTEERFVNELIGAFDHAKHDDDRVRQYLALAMGRSANSRFVDPLVNALRAEKEENIYSLIYALGMLRDKKAVAAILPYLENSDAKIRLVSVIALGNIGDLHSVEPLKKALFDSEPNVQWDAAIALAKMKDSSGKGILLKLLDRGYLSQFPEVDSQEQNHILLVAVEAASALNDSELKSALVKLSKDDQNMNVRSAALAIVK